MGDYQIRPGDNLWKIVRTELKIDNNSEIAEKVEEIAKLNNIKNINSIFVGQKIKLSEQEKPAPKPQKTIFTVQSCFNYQTEPPSFASNFPDIQLSTTKPESRPQKVEESEKKAETPASAPKVLKVKTQKPSKPAAKTSLHNIDVTTQFNGTAEEIDEHLGGVLKGSGEKFLELQQKYGINAAFLAAIAISESKNGTSHNARRRNNVGGIRYKNSYKFRTYGSVGDCLEDMASLLKRRYINEGRTTIGTVGSKYCPVKDKSDKEGINKYWYINVGTNMRKIDKQNTSSA